MYVEDAVQHLQSAKSGNASAGVAALSLESSAPPTTLWVLVDLERPVFCPENSICVASKLEVHPRIPFNSPATVEPSHFARLNMRPAAA
jgi:hypothetical protein